jgi:hypothetical protein
MPDMHKTATKARRVPTEAVEELRSVDAGLRRLANMLELAHDQGDDTDREKALDLAAGWLWRLAEQLEVVHCRLGARTVS